MVIKRYRKDGNVIHCIEESGHLIGASGPITKETRTMFWVRFTKPNGYMTETSVRKDSIVDFVRE